MAMQISLPGVLKRAAAVCKRVDRSGLEFSLEQLLAHLREMRRRKDEPGIVDQFFAVWSDEGHE
jgi:hypothetical protein